MRSKIMLVVIVVVAIFLAFFDFPQAWDRGADAINRKLHIAEKKYKIPHFINKPYRLGLDLQGGTHLVYEADLSNVGVQSAADAMAGARDVVERRVNLFGVSEPLVQIEGNNRIVVELAGISDVNEAIKLIGQTPFLEFKEQLPREEGNRLVIEKLGEDAVKNNITADQICSDANQGFLIIFLQQYQVDPCYKSTGLSGRHLSNSQLVFDPTLGSAQVSLSLNGDGAKLFGDITRRNLGKQVAIYLDGAPITAPPVVQSEITSGDAVISGNFTVQEAKNLANRLNAGALPVPIKSISQQTIGASLGAESLQKSLKAGIYALIAVMVFMIAFYRLPGLASVIALCIYLVVLLAIYKTIPVTLTLAGIAGFILSLGIAVDANVLIFARLREELAAGRTLRQAVDEGFRRAWFSIRDSHVTTILGSLVLYLFSTSIVKGFALTLGIGVLLSLFSSIVVTRMFLNLAVRPSLEKYKKLF